MFASLTKCLLIFYVYWDKLMFCAFHTVQYGCCLLYQITSYALKRLQKHEESVLLFAKDPHVSVTNNRAERDLRMSKVKQKVSGCFRSEQYAKAYCRISSYLQTMTNTGYNPLIAIQMALADKLDLLGGE